MRAIGIILAGGNNNRMRELSNKRAIAAMPIAGSYRAIDFALSNMANSHIQKVAVLTQYNARSLNEHLSSSKWWDFGRKQGGLYVFTPTITRDNSLWYQGTADAIYQNLTFLKNSHEPYVVIASGDGIYKLDYNKVLEYHIAKRAAGYGIEGITIDGNDVFKVYEEAQKAVEKARKGGGPTIIECMTYRWQGHHVGDPGLYRPEEEVEEWKAKEPLKILEDKKLLTDEEIAEIKEMVEKEIQEACKFAEESPYPDMAEAYTDVFVD